MAVSGSALVLAALAANRFFSAAVRIQANHCSSACQTPTPEAVIGTKFKPTKFREGIGPGRGG